MASKKELVDRRTGEVLQAPEKRGIPAVPCPEADPSFGALLCHGLDTLEETLSIKITPEWVVKLEEAKAKAKDADPAGGAVVHIYIGPESVNVAAYGGQGGVKWVFQHPSFLVRIRGPETEWNVSIRYLSVGLWEHGPEWARALAHNMVNHLGERWAGQHIAIKRLDYAFDIESAAFGAMMRDKRIIFDIVSPSKAKIFPVMTSGGVQTITIGSKRGVEVQVYDKTREIREASGKEWMRDLWRAGGKASGDLMRDVWRVECRFAKEFLRERACQTADDASAILPELVAEALYNHRLVIAPEGDDTRMRRWPVHPLWSLCIKAGASADFAGLGRVFTKRRTELAEQLRRQAAGTLRAALVAEHGEAPPVRSVASEVAGVSKRLGEAMEDDVKIDRLRDRYRFLDNGR